jgi:signal transduction histidine kinase
MLRAVTIAGCLFCLGGGAWAEAAPLRTVKAVRSLTRDEILASPAVDVECVVLFRDNNAGDAMTIADESGAIYVDISQGRSHGLGATVSPQAGPMRRGSKIRVEGIASPGGFAPVIFPKKITLLGTAPLPVARELPFSEVMTGAYDCQRISLKGVIQEASLTDSLDAGVLRLEIATRGGRFAAYCEDPAGLPMASLIDADVKLTGVCYSYFNPRRELVGVHLRLTDQSDFEILQAPDPDPFAAPEVALSAVRGFSIDGQPAHRRRVRGVVTLVHPGKFLYLQGDASAVRVWTRATTDLHVGDTAEASGFPDMREQFAAVHGAVVRRTGQASIPEAALLSRQAVLGDNGPRDWDGRLVRFTARLLRLENAAGGAPRIFLESDGRVVTAELPAPIPSNAFQPDSQVGITGICNLKLTDGWPALDFPKPASFTILLRSADDVRVIGAPSWWTRERLTIALSSALLALGVALGAAWWLRRLVGQRSRDLAQEMQARHAAGVEFNATLRERQRLAADLHDTLEQSLTGLSLQIQAAEGLREESPERSIRHLGLARQLLTRSREDVRRSIWNLRSQTLDGHSLGEALREIAALLSEGRLLRIEVEESGPIRPLTDFLAGNLLLLAQEGITNALKHSAASSISVALRYEAAVITLVITDDGCGFEPAGIAGAHEGHFGLQGMKERMKRLGGTLTIDTAKGRGVTIRAAAPWV